MFNLGSIPVISIFPMNDFASKLSIEANKLENIILGNGSTNSIYKQVVLKIKNNNWVFASAKEKRFALVALHQESNLLEKSANNFHQLLSAILDHSEFNLSKYLLKLYFAKLWTLDRLNLTAITIAFLKSSLLHYQGRNSFVVNTKNEPMILNGNFQELLHKHKNQKLADIGIFYRFATDDEFFSQLKLSKVLIGFQSIEFGAVSSRLFDESREHKAKSARTINGRLIGEEVAAILLEKSKQHNITPIIQWQDLILDLVGDPRSFQKRFEWDRIGSNLREYFIGILSRGDLIEFLESISDGSGDTIYQYRKAFWSKYVESVKTTRLLICPRDYEHLRITNPNMRRRFETLQDSYGRLEKGDKSFIYIDFGKIKIIEGTHRATIRFYTKIPTWFQHNKYDLYDRSDICRVAHNSINHHKTKSWQEETKEELRKFGIYQQ